MSTQHFRVLSEEGHADKIADLISDVILDFLAQDLRRVLHVKHVKTGFVLVGGESTL